MGGCRVGIACPAAPCRLELGRGSAVPGPAAQHVAAAPPSEGPRGEENKVDFDGALKEPLCVSEACGGSSVPGDGVWTRTAPSLPTAMPRDRVEEHCWCPQRGLPGFAAGCVPGSCHPHAPAMSLRGPGPVPSSPTRCSCSPSHLAFTNSFFFHFILAVWELLHSYLMLCASQAPSSSTWGRCAPRGTSCPQGRTPRQSQSIPEAACSPSPRTFVYYLSA